MVISNVQTFLDIATSALSESERLSAEGQPKKPDGTPGNLIIFDPEQRSFKQALVAIVFSAAYLEALFHIEGYRKFGPVEYERIDRKTYREKLQAFGISDQALLDESDRFRETRKELLHEKAVKESIEGTSILRLAQHEARNAVDFVKKVTGFLRPAGNAGSTAG